VVGGHGDPSNANVAESADYAAKGRNAIVTFGGSSGLDAEAAVGLQDWMSASAAKKSQRALKDAPDLLTAERVTTPGPRIWLIGHW
jgi:hypothetical protein